MLLGNSYTFFRIASKNFIDVDEDSNFAGQQAVGDALMASGNPYAMAAGAAFKALSAEIQKGDTIKIQDIDNYLVMGGNVPNVSVQEGLIAQFEEWIINYNEEKRQNIKKRGQNHAINLWCKRQTKIRANAGLRIPAGAGNSGCDHSGARHHRQQHEPGCRPVRRRCRYARLPALYPL